MSHENSTLVLEEFHVQMSPITKNYIFIHSNTSHLIQSWVNLILHLTWSQKGNTQVIKSRLQQASHHIIPSTWASTSQAAQDTWTPQQLVLAEAVVRERDHDTRGLCPWDQCHPIHSYKILIIFPQIQLSFISLKPPNDDEFHHGWWKLQFLRLKKTRASLKGTSDEAATITYSTGHCYSEASDTLILLRNLRDSPP